MAALDLESAAAFGTKNLHLVFFSALAKCDGGE
jgi:hypothetical protein